MNESIKHGGSEPLPKVEFSPPQPTIRALYQSLLESVNRRITEKNLTSKIKLPEILQFSDESANPTLDENSVALDGAHLFPFSSEPKDLRVAAIPVYQGKSLMTISERGESLPVAVAWNGGVLQQSWDRDVVVDFSDRAFQLQKFFHQQFAKKRAEELELKIDDEEKERILRLVNCSNLEYAISALYPQEYFSAGCPVFVHFENEDEVADEDMLETFLIRSIGTSASTFGPKVREKLIEETKRKWDYLHFGKNY